MGEEVRAEVIQQTSVPGMIYQLIGKAMCEIGAIGKDSKNVQQGFMYRGVDAVYNALNPVMAKYGLFITPEILDQKREERTTKNGAVLVYTILTIRYTVYAPDGSFVQMTVVGEGMDSGDKSNNKAMSVAMKYAMFQLFMIPTEELKDPDAECFNDVLPKGSKPTQPTKAPAAKNDNKPQAKAQNAQASAVAVTTSTAAPPVEAPKPNPPDVTTGKGYIQNEMAFMAKKLNLDKEAMKSRFAVMRKALIDGGIVQDIPANDISLEEAQKLCRAMYENYIDDQVA